MIKLLDCTLRDGGYINDWNFGKFAIKDIIANLEKTNIDILELGFLKNEEYNSSRTVFNDISQISNFMSKCNNNVQYSAMIEVLNPIKLENLSPCTEKTVDIIRVIIWKTKHDNDNNEIDALYESYEYCKGVVEKGYKLCIQPARVDQYTDEEFVSMIKLYNNLDPYALYIVDSWGTRQAPQIMHYANLADEYLNNNVAIGYHGHNNMMQVNGIAKEFIKLKCNRDLFIDGSIYGIGRCAGNLNIEVFAKYLNDVYNTKYNLAPMYYIYDKYIKRIYDEHKWGYSIYYFLTAIYNVHPNYAWYLGHNKNIDPLLFEKLLISMNQKDRILYSEKKADILLNNIKKDICNE